MNQYSIGVVTYINRFEEYFKPLVLSLEKIFPGVQKNYILNGYYDQVKQAEYLVKAKQFLKNTSADKIIEFNEHHALAHCWNQLIINSKSNKVLILNDDLKINYLFKLFFNAQAGLYREAVINGSWSHFLISKETIKKVGWFDERFVGMGSEDADYALRLAFSEGLKIMPNSYINNIYCLGVKNIVASDQDPGWKNISGFSHGKYAEENHKFFNAKWEVLKTPKDGYIYGFGSDYYKINPQMQTPEFYPLSVLEGRS